MASSTRQPLTMAQLTTLINASPSALPADMLADMLADYESEAAMLSLNAEQNLITGFYASYLIALLLVSNLLVEKTFHGSRCCIQVRKKLTFPNSYSEEARYLTRRWPTRFNDKDRLLVSSKSLLKANWSNKYPLVHQILQETSWPAFIKPLIARFRDQFQSSILAELSLAYSSLRHDKLSTLLSLCPNQGTNKPSVEILEKLTESGWKWDDEKNLWFTPSTKNEFGVANNESSLANDGMSGLVGLVGFLGE
ncbi:MAG: hypothetical protein M1835_001787 [Candelina submexicana]|nr:MAG: hypothetical protein M1835_001787 [Candelina submexicana]